MLSRWFRTFMPRLFSPVNRLLLRAGLTPDGMTVIGLLLAVVSGGCIARNYLLPGAAALLFSGLFNSLDGEMARLRGQPSRLGPFIDSVADHYGDFAIYLGLVWRALAANDALTVLLVFAAMFGSLVGSHIRSRAGMTGIDLKNVGFFTRLERNVVLLLGLLTGWVTPALALLALASNLSALQRLAHALRAGRT